MDSSELTRALDFELPFEKLGLAVGAPLNLEAAELQLKYRVKLIGYYPGHSIIVSSPVIEGKQVVVNKDRPFKVRSLAKNNAFAFQTTVKAVALQPFPYIHLDYPKAMVTLQVRNADRLQVSLNARITSEFDLGNGEWPKLGLIYNLSKTGAGIRCNDSLGDNGDEVVVHFPVVVAGVTKNFKLIAVVRNKGLLGAEWLPHRYIYGLQFRGLSGAANIVLSSFIYEQQT